MSNGLGRKIKRIIDESILFPGVEAAGAVLLMVARSSPEFDQSPPLRGEGAGSRIDIHRLSYAVFPGIPVAACGLFACRVVPRTRGAVGVPLGGRTQFARSG